MDQFCQITVTVMCRDCDCEQCKAYTGETRGRDHARYFSDWCDIHRVAKVVHRNWSIMKLVNHETGQIHDHLYYYY